MASPTQRTLAYLRKEDWTVGVVEKWNPHARIRQDFLGCIDLIACQPGKILGIQATSDSNVNARIVKSKALPGLRAWLEAGGLFWVIGWGKKGARGKVKRWTPRIVEIKLEDL